ncbi:GNAT family N-acetyltransferase [Actinomyces faecalis]|uniref:GNAT family N-acetyltransferase n=1 Tax=Actinomyces faecalis TaxID=2722820 RepID=UPI0015577DFF|nr:GNAT family N-acetyltransferase [Actinomyces faecalis]
MRIIHRPVTAVGRDQVDGLLALCALDPVGGANLAHQLLRWSRWGHGDVVVAGRVGHPDGGGWATGSVIPFGLGARTERGHDGASRAQVRALADHARRRLVNRGSVFGPACDVEPVWRALAEGGTRSREERWNQPLLVAPPVAGGLTDRALARRPGLEWVATALRAAQPGEEPLVLPASVAMFTSELGYDPMSAGGSYARHVDWLVAVGRSYVVIDDGEGRLPLPGGPRSVAFKADVGAVWSPPGQPGVAQLTGVWTRPDLRGRGVASAALAATVDAVRRDHVGSDGTVSLYANDFNAPALALYRGLGFERVGTFSTVLL